MLLPTRENDVAYYAANIQEFYYMVKYKDEFPVVTIPSFERDIEKGVAPQGSYLWREKYTIKKKIENLRISPQEDERNNCYRHERTEEEDLCDF